MPVVSTVTWAISGSVEPAAVNARRAPTIAAFAWSRSCAVSTRIGVGPAVDEAGDLLLVGVAQGAVRGVPERRQLRARADRAEHEPRIVRGRPPVGDLAGQPRTRLRQLIDAVGDVVLGQVCEIGAETVGFDRVAADLVVRVMNSAHDVGPGDVQNLVAALEPLEVVEVEFEPLQHGAHRAVGDDDPMGELMTQQVSAAVHSLNGTVPTPPRPDRLSCAAIAS